MTQLSRRAAVQQVALAGAGLVILPNLGWLASAQERDREVVPFEDIPEGFSTRRPGDFALPGQATTGIDLRELYPLPPGSHTIASRPTDRRGRTQPADLSLKKSNWENNAIWVRKIRV